MSSIETRKVINEREDQEMTVCSVDLKLGKYLFLQGLCYGSNHAKPLEEVKTIKPNVIQSLSQV